MNTMGVSTSDNMTLMRDAWSIFADEHHAQMVMPTLSKMKFASDSI
ncbi:gp17 domain protein [Burkholderia cepacia]|uniref:Gp17 domain protein n=1 Tax=Burkholderia cepacia TaxID=292 RepID=A0AA89CIW9_BURCE|nr:gp17 domain protein [Burkholderia cepacia]